MSSTIRSVECLQLRLPFDHGAPAPLFAGRPRTTLDSGLVRVELDNGLVGWGESYGAELDALSALFRGRIAPLAIGRDAMDATLMASLERTLHNMGRSGPVLHALSGVDIALWDLKAKMAGLPLHALLGGARRTRIPAYASLLQYYGDKALVQQNVDRALAAGFDQVKLHEKTLDAVAAARGAMGPDVPLMVDTNCAWTAAQATDAVDAMAAFDLRWIEEPIWPPEDIDALQALRAQTGVATAVGENASSVHELSLIARAGAADFLQPSAIKSGGVTTLLRLSRECAGTRVHCAPQSAFFGPGLLATLHVLAAQEDEVHVERLFCDLGFTPYGETIPCIDGAFELTDAPGLGADPDPALLDSGFVRHAG